MQVKKKRKREEGGETYKAVLENLLPLLITFSTLFKKSSSVATFLLALIANIPASVQTLLNSAPVAFGHNLEIKSNRMLRDTDIDLAWIRRIWARPAASGGANSTLRSIRPGRSNAGSNVSGLGYTHTSTWGQYRCSLKD